MANSMQSNGIQIPATGNPHPDMNHDLGCEDMDDLHLFPPFSSVGGAVNSYMQSLLENGDPVFSCEDLNDVIDPNCTGDLTFADLDTENACHWSSQAFIEVKPDTKQIQGVTDSSGNYRLRVLCNNGTYQSTVSSDNSRSSEYENGSGVAVANPSVCDNGIQSQNEANSSPCGTVASQDSQCGTVKIRKPRGRKPKALKEAEAAAAAAAAAETRAANTGMLHNLREKETSESIPTVVVHHKPTLNQQESDASLQGRMTNHQQQYAVIQPGNVSDARPYSSGLKFGQSLTNSDRNAVLCKNSGTHEVNGLRPNQVPYYPQSSAPAQSYQQTNQAYGALTGNVRRVGGDVLHCNGAAHTSNETKSRLEELFSSRISNTGGPKRSTVAPSYIQRNLGLYNQLTAPKKQSDFESRNSTETQEKWTQRPNPSALALDSGVPSTGSGFGLEGHNMYRGSLQQIRKPVEAHNGRAISVPISMNLNDEVNMESEDNFVYMPSGSMRGNFTSFPRSFGMHRYRPYSLSDPENDHVMYLKNELRMMRSRIELLNQDNVELKMRSYYLLKVNKQLAARLRHACEQSQHLRICLDQQAELQQLQEYYPMNREFGIENSIRNDDRQNGTCQTPSQPVIQIKMEKPSTPDVGDSNNDSFPPSQNDDTGIKLELNSEGSGSEEIRDNFSRPSVPTPIYNEEKVACTSASCGNPNEQTNQE